MLAATLITATLFSGVLAPAAHATTPAQSGEKYGLISGDVNDGGFNQLAWEGMQQAADELSVEVQHIESDEANAYDNIAQLIDEGYSGIIAVGYGLSNAVKAQSQANPEIPFVIVDAPSRSAGSMGLLFDVDEPAFMAGYLAAGMTETGTVCAYGGLQTPPVLAFLVGFESGVNYYNTQNQANVELIGWQTDPTSVLAGEGVFAGGFTSQFSDQAEAISADMLDQGCDIIFPVAGALSTVTAEFAQENDIMVIGVDADQTQTEPQVADVFLTSVVKKIDVAVLGAIERMQEGTFKGGDNHIANIANGEVGLAPFHSFEDSVPQALKDDLAAIEIGLIDKTISTGWPIYATATTLRLDATALANATYPAEFATNGMADLVAGVYEEEIPDSASKITIQMSPIFDFGDLDGDGVQDAAVVLIAETGGSGVFYTLYAVMDRNGLPYPVASVPLGDRIKLNDVDIQNGEIVVDLVTQGPDDPMSDPTKPETLRFSLVTQLNPVTASKSN
jgi:basic membrane protein A and related proteins